MANVELGQMRNFVNERDVRVINAVGAVFCGDLCSWGNACFNGIGVGVVFGGEVCGWGVGDTRLYRIWLNAIGVTNDATTVATMIRVIIRRLQLA